jgi:hypothetical protein
MTRRFFALLTLIILVAPAASAAWVEFSVTFSAGGNLTTNGSAQYHNWLGDKTEGHIWGAIYINNVTSGGHIAINSFNTTQGTWAGTLSITAPTVTERTCFNGFIDTFTDGFNQGEGTNSECLNPPAPPPSNGDILTVSDPNEPLVIDLNGDGIQTTGVNDMVWFDLDGNGVKDHLTWTKANTQEGFLWVDLFGKNRVDNGSELFGIGTVMPNGSKAPDGFTALAMYDQASQGGNGDGVIDSRDAVWTKLRVWVDSNHDGVCDPGEVRPLAAYNGVSLTTVTANTVDAAGNRHELRSECWRKNGNRREPLDIESIGFQGTLH